MNLVVHAFLFAYTWLDEHVATYKSLLGCIDLHTWLQVDNIRSLPRAKPLEVTFTGMIKSSVDGGHIDDSIRIFEYMKDHCAPNIGAINTMLKVYGQNDMFAKAKVLFEEVKAAKSESYATPGGGNSSVVPDAYTYNAMLEASASAQQWEYFEHVYREMIVSGYQLDQNKHLLLLVKASRAGKVENILIYIQSMLILCLLIVSYPINLCFKLCLHLRGPLSHHQFSIRVKRDCYILLVSARIL